MAKHRLDQMNEFTKAAENGNLEHVKELIEQGVPVNAKNDQLITAIYAASRQGQHKIVKHLIGCGGDVNIRCKDQNFHCLHAAAASGDVDTLEYLLTESLMEVDIINDDRNTPLIMAAQSSNTVAVLELLASKGANVHTVGYNENNALTVACMAGQSNAVKWLIEQKCDVNHINGDGFSALHCACNCGSPECVDLLLENGANYEELTKDSAETDNGDWTALQLACHTGSKECVELLLKKNVDIHKINKNNDTAFHIAAKGDHLDIIKLLHTSGDTNINVLGYNGNSALLESCLAGHIDVVTWLIQNNADVSCVNKNDWSALHCACFSGSAECVQLLLENECDIEAKTRKRETPVHIAAMNNHLNILKLLKSAGANLKITGYNGHSLLTSTSRNKDSEIVGWLLEQGADVKHVDHNRNSALHHACTSGSMEVVRLLVTNNVDLESRNIDRATPIMYASLYGHFPIVQYLHKNGAKIDVFSDTYGLTNLSLACMSGNKDLVQWLIDQGLNLNHKINQPFAEVYHNYQCEDPNSIVKQIERQCVSHRDSNIKNGCNLVTLAAVGSHLPILKLLKNHGASMSEVCDTIHLTALTVACFGGQTEMSRWLIEEGLDVNHRTASGHTGLHITAIGGYFYTLELLVQHGAEVNAKTNKGMTALMFAAEKGHFSIVKYLLENTDAGKDAESIVTSLSLAKKNLHEDVVGLLQFQETSFELPSANEPSKEEKANTTNMTKVQWTSEEKLSLISSCNISAIFIGEKMSGKTSLVRSLLTNTQYQTLEKDRTVVANDHQWILPNNRTINVIDLGGHDSYKCTSAFFMYNSSSNVVHLCHDIVSNDYKVTFEWLQDAICLAPQSCFYFILTKEDALPDGENLLEVKRNFVIAMQKFITAEICDIEEKIMMMKQNERLSDQNERSSEQKSINKIKSVLERYDKLKSDLPNLIFTTSAAPGYYNSISMIKNNLIHWSEDPQNSKEVPQVYQSFYQEIGMLKRKNEKEIQDFLSYQQAKEIFSSVYLKLHGSSVSNDCSFRRCVSYFNEIGLIRWFEGTEILESVVFHNMETFLQVIRSIFHHDNKVKLDFNSLKSRQKVLFEKKPQKFNKSVTNLQNYGILSNKLLCILLQLHNCEANEEIVRDMLVKLGTAFAFKSGDKDETFLFIPYFIESQKISVATKDTISQMKYCSSEELVFELNIHGNLSRFYYNQMVVKLLQHLHINSPTQKRDIWNNGFMASVGTCKLAFTYKSRELIQCLLKGKPNNLPTMWEYLKYISEKSAQLRNEWLPGIITALMFKCTHCKIKNVLQILQQDSVQEWDLEEDILDIPSDLYEDTAICQIHNEEIPGGLVYPVLKGSNSSAEMIERVSKYLKAAYATESLNMNPNGTTRNTAIQLHTTVSDHKFTEEELLYILTHLSPGVCRVTFDFGREGGTGFVVGGLQDQSTGLFYRFVLTCYHLKVQQAIHEGKPCQAEFGVTSRISASPFAVPIVPIHLYSNSSMDYVLLKLEHSSVLESHLQENLGNLVKDILPTPNEPLVIIGHEDIKKCDVGAYSVSKQDIAVQKLIQERINHGEDLEFLDDNNYTLYQCKCSGGTSGSPVFSVHNQRLYAMHCGGIANTADSVEFGVKLWNVVLDIKRQIDQQGFRVNGLTHNDLYQLFPHFPGFLPLSMDTS